jgi:hypothetical protein
MRLILVIAAIPAAITPFMPFTLGTAPANVFYRLAKQPLTQWSFDMDLRIGLLAAPFVLGILILLLQLRLLVAGRITIPEKIIAMSLGFFCALMTLTFVGTALFDQAGSFNSISAEDWAILFIGPVVISVGWLATWRLARRHAKSEIIASGWLYTAYLANAGLCLAVFRDNRDPGWYITAVASLAMIVEFIGNGFWGARGTPN